MADLSKLTATQLKTVIQQLRSAGITPDQAEMNRRMFDQAFIDLMLYGTSYTIHGTSTGRMSSSKDFFEKKPRAPQPEPQKVPSVSEQLPKEQLLLKLLKMTTSSNDGEALTAIRKVNTLLTDNGWDWDKLIAAKIKIVENPFVGLGTPPRVPPSPPPQPVAPKAPLSGQRVRSLGVNKFADFCYCCGIEVIAQAGGFFKREDYNLNAKSANPRSLFSVVCSSCEGKALVWDQPALPIRKKGKAAVGDLV